MVEMHSLRIKYGALVFASMLAASLGLSIGSPAASAAASRAVTTRRPAAPQYTVLITHWTIVSHKMTGSGSLKWKVWSDAPFIDYRIQRVASISDEECAGTDNSISGSLEVSFSVLEGALGLSVEKSHGWNNSHCISETINLPRKAIGWPEWRWTWQEYKIVQKPWVCTERNGTTRCSHFPRNFEPGSFVGKKNKTIHVHIQSHPEFRFGQCKHTPKKGQTCPIPQ